MQVKTIRDEQAQNKNIIIPEKWVLWSTILYFPIFWLIWAFIAQFFWYSPIAVTISTTIPIILLFVVPYLIIRSIIRDIMEYQKKDNSIPIEFTTSIQQHNNRDIIDTVDSIPRHIYSQWIIYITEKEKLIKNSDVLKNILISDISTAGTSYTTISQVMEAIELFSSQLTHTTDTLIWLLPEDTDIMSDFGSNDIFYGFVTYLQDEMDWLKKISRDQQNLIQQWTLYHSIEVLYEKDKIKESINESNDNFNHSIGILMSTLDIIKERWDMREEGIHVRQIV